MADALRTVADMGSKRSGEASETGVVPVDGYLLGPPRRGRPPRPPRTRLAVYLRDHGLTTRTFAAHLAEIARATAGHGLTRDDAPSTKQVLDAVNGDHAPTLFLVLLVELATDGDVTLRHWVADLIRIRRR